MCIVCIVLLPADTDLCIPAPSSAMAVVPATCHVSACWQWRNALARWWKHSLQVLVGAQPEIQHACTVTAGSPKVGPSWQLQAQCQSHQQCCRALAMTAQHASPCTYPVAPWASSGWLPFGLRDSMVTWCHGACSVLIVKQAVINKAMSD